MSCFPDIYITRANTDVNSIKTRFEKSSPQVITSNFEVNCFANQNLMDGEHSNFFENSDYFIVLLGEIYTYREFRNSTFKGSLFEKVSLEIQNETFDINELNGHFLLIVIPKKNGQTHVYTNRLGTFHGYYSQELGIISSHFGSIKQLNSGNNIDFEAIKQFVKYGFFTNDSTYFTNCKVFSPASHYTFDKELTLLNKESYWQFEYKPTNISQSEVLREYDNILTEVMRDLIVDDTIVLPISGGLDSRNTVGIASKINPNLKSYSYGLYADNPETRISKKIATARKLSFKSEIITNYLFDRKDDIIDSVEGFQYIDGTRQVQMSEWLSANSKNVIAAHWGDVWNDSMKVTENDLDLNYFLDKKFAKRGFKNVYRYFGWNDKEGIKPFEKQLEEFESQSNGDRDFCIKMLKTFQWSHRWTMASIRAYQLGTFPRLPFYDNRIVDFFMTLPLNLVKERNLQIEYLKLYHPDLAKIVWQEYGRNLFNFTGFNNRHIIFRIYKKIRSLFKGKVILRNWEVFYLGAENEKRLRQIFKDDAKAQTLLDEFYANPDAANGYSISVLLTLKFMDII